MTERERSRTNHDVADQMRQLLTTKQVSRETGIKEGTLRYWRHNDEGPKSFTLNGGRVVYRRSDVEEWLDAQEASSSRGGVA